MSLETKYLRLKTPVTIGSRFGDWRSQFRPVIETLRTKRWVSFRRLELHLCMFPEDGRWVAEEFFKSPENLERESEGRSRGAPIANKSFTHSPGSECESMSKRCTDHSLDATVPARLLRRHVFQVRQCFVGGVGTESKSHFRSCSCRRCNRIEQYRDPSLSSGWTNV
jgi:hypothetical protein